LIRIILGSEIRFRIRVGKKLDPDPNPIRVSSQNSKALETKNGAVDPDNGGAEAQMEPWKISSLIVADPFEEDQDLDPDSYQRGKMDPDPH
jgi:hypothetical protein